MSIIARLALTPYAVLVVIGAAGLVGLWTGWFAPGPSNTFAFCGTVATALGLAVGGLALLHGGGLGNINRGLIAVTYLPAAIVSLLLSGL